MAKVRVHELAKELGKENKEIINFLSDKGISVKSHMSSIEEEQVSLVKKAFHKNEAKDTKETKDAAAEGAPAKKKNITHVFHPQNSRSGASRPKRPVTPAKPAEAQQAPAKKPEAQQVPAKKPEAAAPVSSAPTPAAPVQAAQTQSAPAATPQARPQQNNGQTRPQQNPQNRTQGNRPQGGGNYQGNRSQGSSNYQGNRPQGGGNYQGNRPQGGGNYQGNRPQGSSNYQGNRPQGGGGYQGNRPQGGGNYQGNRPNGGGGYQGNRPNGGGGYQGNRPNGGGGYQGNRPQGGGNYQGNRPNGGGGYQGNRPQGGGNYQGNRPNGGGGYQGNRPNGGGGYQGNRPNGGGNYQGNRPQNGRSAAPAMEKPVTKESRARNDRGRNDNRGKEKFDKFESKSSRLGGKNNTARGKNNRVDTRPAQVQEKKEDEIKTIILPETMTIRELADKMKIQAAAIVKKLFLQGVMVTVNQEVDFDKAEEIALEYNCIAEKEVKVDVIEELLREDEEDESKMVSRPPVVCVMGHVDHGKTSLLDAIRNTHVIAKEAGGITQHIGAYVVSINDQKITFLDTPGHEAFTAMRMRGANATDIAILVVAADDGVMPQTIEAINHAKAAGTEIIVAINKIDKPSANIERVKQELSEYELIPEDWGGSTIFVPVSAHTQEGIDTLLEMILLTAEVAELKANPDREARGLVIEAELDKGKGPVATVLVQKGTLHVGDPIACGSAHGKVRAMIDDQGRRVKVATPSTPVEILGLSDVPNAGEIFVACETEKDARTFAETFVSEGRERLLEDTKARMSLDDLFTQIQAGDLKELNIIVKADVQGSVEAVKQSLVKLSNEEVVVKIIHGGVGAINESDVSLASASNAIIIGFNVRPDVMAKTTAEHEGVDVRLYRVIYDAIADVEAAMKGMLDPVFEEKVLGHAEVRQTFKASGVGTIAGSYVLDGMFQRGCSVRITREGKQIFEGALASLKRFKDDVKEVKTGYECGLVFEKFNDIQEFDQVEAYTMVEVPR